MAAVAGLDEPKTSAPSRADALLPRLRAAAARCAELLGGGVLLFAHLPAGSRAGTPPPLRAAAGFDSSDAARNAASALDPLVREAGEAPEAFVASGPASLGAACAAGVHVVPLGVEGRVWGALLGLLPAAPKPGAAEAFAAVGEAVGLRLDHSFLAARMDSLEGVVAEKRRAEEEKSDEILKLSEALFAQDIELLRSSEKLGSVEKLKSDFIDKMSRELRTPLNAIIESIISVLAGENEQLSDSAKQSLRSALDDGTAFLRTLGNILDVWRIKQGELPVESQEVNFREVVEEAIFSVQDTLGDKPVTIEKRLTEPLPKIRTDLAKINQILFLLLDNAAKFTERGTIQIAAEVSGGRLRCTVKDTGIGVCPDDRQFIFDEFFQVDDTATSTYRGAGLGLTLVRDLLALLDGEIRFDSEVGAGTEVEFQVPVQVAG